MGRFSCESNFSNPRELCIHRAVVFSNGRDTRVHHSIINITHYSNFCREKREVSIKFRHENKFPLREIFEQRLFGNTTISVGFLRSNFAFDSLVVLELASISKRYYSV